MENRMKDLSLIERSKFYTNKYPDRPPLRADDRWVDGSGRITAVYLFDTDNEDEANKIN